MFGIFKSFAHDMGIDLGLRILWCMLKVKVLLSENLQ